MTDQECNNAIEKLVRKYNDNERRIASLNEEIAEVREGLERIAEWLSSPRDVHQGVDGDSRIFTHKGRMVRTQENTRSVDGDKLHSLLSDLHHAYRCKERMEGNLRRASLEKLIRE